MNNPSWSEKFKERKIGQTLFVYLGSAWVFIEALNFLIEKYSWEAGVLDTLIILVIFGLPAVVFYVWFDGKFTKKAIVLQVLNLVIAFSVIGYDYIKPGSIETRQLRLIKAGTSKKQIAESIQSIVILPFDNYTGSDEFEYLVSGIHSSLITDMGQLGGLRVMCKTTANSFKDTDMSLTEIATELNVDAVVEGSISCVDEDSVCVQIRLISALGEEQQLWVEDYRVAKSQFLNFYNDVTKRISEEINIVLTPQEESLLAEARTVDPEAYVAYLKGQYYWDQLSADSIQQSLQWFELAIQKEPEWADPYVGLSQAWSLCGRFGLIPESIARANKLRYLERAIELNPESAKVHYGKANHAVWTDWDWKLGEKEYIKTLELNPNDALARLYYAHLLMILRRSDEAVHQANLGLSLDPLRPLILGLYGVVMEGEGNYQSAISAFEKARTIGTDFAFAAVNILPNLYKNGDYEEWIRTWEIKVRDVWNDTARESVVDAFYEKGHIAAVEEMFKMNAKYGNGPGNAYMTNSLKAQRSMYLGKPEVTIDYLEKMFESDQNSLEITYIGTNLYFYDQLKTYPRYIELLKKMNLPTGEKTNQLSTRKDSRGNGE